MSDETPVPAPTEGTEIAETYQILSRRRLGDPQTPEQRRVVDRIMRREANPESVSVAAFVSSI